MSNTTPTAMKIPREFVPTFIAAASQNAIYEAEELTRRGSGAPLRLLAHEVLVETFDSPLLDSPMTTLHEALEVRAAIVRARDNDTPVQTALLRRLLNEACAYLECKVGEHDRKDLDDLARVVDTLGKMRAWRAEEIAPTAVTA